MSNTKRVITDKLQPSRIIAEKSATEVLLVWWLNLFMGLIL
jgi:hypothetical protein